MRSDGLWGAMIWMLVLAAAIGAVFILSGGVKLQTTSETISLWSGAEVKCDDLQSTFFLWSMPATARLTVDTDPVAPFPPFYYGGIVSIHVNDRPVKSYDPPLLDRDTLDVVQHLRTGFNTVKIVPKVAAILCNIQTQATVSGWLELTYSSGGDGGGGGGGGQQPSMILVAAGLATVAAAAFFILRRR